MSRGADVLCLFFVLSRLVADIPARAISLLRITSASCRHSRPRRISSSYFVVWLPTFPRPLLYISSWYYVGNLPTFSRPRRRPSCALLRITSASCRHSHARAISLLRIKSASCRHSPARAGAPPVLFFVLRRLADDNPPARAGSLLRITSASCRHSHARAISLLRITPSS